MEKVAVTRLGEKAMMIPEKPAKATATSAKIDSVSCGSGIALF
jgi:hypothetical protein